MSSFSWLILSYLLGSFPSGYLISRARGKDILKIGWRKTSGSNVFKNVGKWPGVLTGTLDVAKGYLAVFGARGLGFSLEIQVLSGILAITGHNWSLFLKFAGGRGIGTLIGAFFSLSPKILGLSLIPFFLFALIWDAAIGTLIFLLSALFFSNYFNQSTIEFFIILALFPILIKRLSPIGEIFPAQNKLSLIRNRLIFDNDQGDKGWRIKRILKKIIKNNPEKIVEAIDVWQLKEMMMASAKKIAFHQEEINKINFFPVADKDTGSNLAATLLGIEREISQKEYHSFLELAKDIKEAALNNTRGNAGMIYTGYLIKFLDEIKNPEKIDALKFTQAMAEGARAAYLAILNPVEGTILDPMKVAGQKAKELSKNEKNIIRILEGAKKESEIALANTKEKLEILKKNDVVDAGALGFVKILEAWLESLKGIPPLVKPPPSICFKEKLKAPLKYRYCFQLSFQKRKEKLPSLKEELADFGESIEILEIEDKIKFHIHTNQPEILKKKFENFAAVKWQIEDMSKKMKELENNANQYGIS